MGGTKKGLSQPFAAFCFNVSDASFLDFRHDGQTVENGPYLPSIILTAAALQLPKPAFWCIAQHFGMIACDHRLSFGSWKIQCCNIHDKEEKKILGSKKVPYPFMRRQAKS